MFKKSITLLFAIASTVAVHAQEYFVRATSPDQLVGDVEFLLVHQEGNNVYVATPEAIKKVGFKGVKKKLSNNRLEVTSSDNLLRLNLKYSLVEKGTREGYQLFTTDEKGQPILIRENRGTQLIYSNEFDKGTTIFEYYRKNATDEYHLIRTGIKSHDYRIIYNNKKKVFACSTKKTITDETLSTCLYVKENPPLSFSSNVNDKKAILYAFNDKVALSDSFTLSVQLVPNHSTVFVGTRKDVMIFTQKSTAEGLTLQNEKGEYLSANNEGTLSFVNTESSETFWEKIGDTQDVALRHKLSTKVLVYTPEKGFELKEEAAATNKVYLYCAALTGSFKMSSAAYGTYYNEDFSYIMPEGLKGSTAILTESGSEKKIVFNYEYPAGSIVPKGTPLVLKSTLEGNDIPGLYSLKSTEEASEVSMHSGNVLRGLQVAGMIPQEGDHKYYKLSKHDDKVGFFFGVAGGAAFKIETNNRAYLVLPSSAASKGFYMDEPILTGIEEVKPNVETKSMYYDLLGRPRATKSKGLNIYNGKKILF